MKLLPLLGPALGAAILLVSSSCQSQAMHQRDHWTAYSVAPSLSRAFLSYDAEKDGSYRDFQWRKKKDIEFTVRRHFFNHNPENPFEAVDKTVYEPRRVHSPVPGVHRYVHLEGLVLGAASYAGGGVFIPIPVDSIIATFEEGGSEEFFDFSGRYVLPGGVETESFLHEEMGFSETKGED